LQQTVAKQFRQLDDRVKLIAYRLLTQP